MLRREYFSLYLDVLMCFDVANINFFCVESMYSLCCNGTSDDWTSGASKPTFVTQFVFKIYIFDMVRFIFLIWHVNELRIMKATIVFLHI